ncbi:ATP-binding cassette domain-containing protein [Nakamurella sp.]|uniref:ATP-binding cassette domain-containing protein n=1 Tax=Nakamurella sp. TaxID=1869182 RepID=UPI00378435E3
MSEQPIMQVHDAGVRYRRGWALRYCSFELRPGAITALVGPNGAGKSTLLLATAGLVGLTEGQISVLGRAVGSSPAHPDLGFLAQDKPLYRQFTVATMLDVGRHLNARWDRGLAERLCDEAALDRRARVRTLSGGQRARLALALVLARRPSLLLLDEPLANLDPLARLQVQQTLLAQAADTGMTVLLSSHILSEIEDACDDLALLAGGRITLHGPIEEVLARHVLLTGPGGDEAGLAAVAAGAVEIRRAPRQLTVLVDGRPPVVPEGWTTAAPTLEEVVVARLRAAAPDRPAAA